MLPFCFGKLCHLCDKKSCQNVCKNQIDVVPLQARKENYIDNMDKDHKIWEMSDGDFLNFLYQEREREYSKSSAWGINFWVVGAAIVALLGYAYNSIADGYSSFDWRLLVYYSTVLGAMMIVVMILLFKYIKNKNWTNEYRVTTIGSNSSSVEFAGKRNIAIASIIFLRYLHDYGIVTWLWALLLMIEIAVSIYTAVYAQKLITTKYRGCVFGEFWLEFVYRALEIILCMSICITALFDWGYSYLLGAKELEMSLVLAIIVGIIWLVRYCNSENKHEVIDNRINQYLYGELSKESTFFYLQAHSQGYDIVDILYTELKKVQPIVKELKEWQNNLRQYEQLIETGNLSFDDSRTYKHVVDNNMEKAKTALDTAKHLNDVMREIIRLDTYPSSMDTFKLLDQQIEELKNELLEFVDRSLVISKQLFEFTRPFLCVQYGGFCKVENCVERHKKPSVFKRIKIRCICAFKNRFSFVNKK